jgi:hypothetical protein
LDEQQRRTRGVFIFHEASRPYGNGRHFDSRMPTRARRIECRPSCVGYPDDLANCSIFLKKVHRDVTVAQQSTCVLQTRQDLSNTSSTKYSIRQICHKVED